MTAPDIVTEARRLPQGPWVFDGSVYEDDTLERLAAAPRLVTDLVAEVERLRQWNINNGTAFSGVCVERDEDGTVTEHVFHTATFEAADAVLCALAERDAAVAEVERLRAALDQRTDPEPDRWYITKTGREFRRRDIVVGPFSSRDDALLARSAIEQRDKPLTYWICPAARLLGGDQ